MGMKSIRFATRPRGHMTSFPRCKWDIVELELGRIKDTESIRSAFEKDQIDQTSDTPPILTIGREWLHEASL